MSRHPWLFSLCMCTVLCIATNAPTAALTVEERMADWDFLHELISENYPFFAIKERLTGENWHLHTDTFRTAAEMADSDEAFYDALIEMVAALQNDHTRLAFPATPKGNQSFYARYIAGQYWVVATAPEVAEDLPLGARVVSVDGVPVDQYVTDPSRGWSVRRDASREKLFVPYLPVPNNPTVTLTYVADGNLFQAELPSFAPAIHSAGEQPNVTTSILQTGQIACLRIRSFNRAHIDNDRSVIRSFLEAISDYQTLIIDIRGNSGGSDRYWEELLVAPLVSERHRVAQYVFVRNGIAAQQALRSHIGLGAFFNRVPKHRLPASLNLPTEVMTSAFADPVLLTREVRPKQSVGFSGDIILLVDSTVYSASETFAAFAQATGWATLVGTPTGGDGIGFDPLQVTLPYSGLTFRMSYTMGLNPDGTANEETQTQPDVVVELDPEEYVEYLIGLRDGQLEVGIPYPEYDRPLRTAIELALAGGMGTKTSLQTPDAQLTPRVVPVFAMGSGLQVGVGVFRETPVTDAQVSATWDLGVHRPGLTFEHKRFFAGGLAASQRLSLRPWRSAPDKTSWAFMTTTGIEWSDPSGRRRASLMLQGAPVATMAPPNTWHRPDVTLAISQTVQQNQRAIHGGVALSHSFDTGVSQAHATGTLLHRLSEEQRLRFDLSVAVANGSDILMLDEGVGLSRNNVDRRGRSAWHASVALQHVLPVPPTVQGWLFSPRFEAHADSLWIHRDQGDFHQGSLGISVRAGVGFGSEQVELRAGWLAPTFTQDEPRWYVAMKVLQ